LRKTGKKLLDGERNQGKLGEENSVEAMIRDFINKKKLARREERPKEVRDSCEGGRQERKRDTSLKRD